MQQSVKTLLPPTLADLLPGQDKDKHSLAEKKKLGKFGKLAWTISKVYRKSLALLL